MKIFEPMEDITEEGLYPTGRKFSNGSGFYITEYWLVSPNTEWKNGIPWEDYSPAWVLIDRSGVFHIEILNMSFDYLDTESIGNIIPFTKNGRFK